MAAGRLRLTVPSLFVLGFFAIFVIGGLTGVMVAMVPFDWQVHDTYFIVAHLHYVLFGGMVFPLFAALYYWAPAFSKRRLSETLGRWSFGCSSSASTSPTSPCISPACRACRGASTPIRPNWAGTCRTCCRPSAPSSSRSASWFAWSISPATSASPRRDAAGDVWKAGTLEWLPNGIYGPRSIPIVRGSRAAVGPADPGRRGGERAATSCPARRPAAARRIVTSRSRPRPQYVLLVPGPSWRSFWAAHLHGGVLPPADGQAGGAGRWCAACCASASSSPGCGRPIPARIRQLAIGGGITPADLQDGQRARTPGGR